MPGISIHKACRIFSRPRKSGQRMENTPAAKRETDAVGWVVERSEEAQQTDFNAASGIAVGLRTSTQPTAPRYTDR